MKTGRESRSPVESANLCRRRGVGAAPLRLTPIVSTGVRRSSPTGWALGICVAIVALPVPAIANQYVRVDYSLTLQNHNRGTVFIELFDDRPLSRDNFMQYVNGGLYNGTFMHRLARNFVLQGGGYYFNHFLEEPAPLYYSLDPTDIVDLDGNINTPNPTVLNEVNNTPFRSNLYGTLAMAKVGPPAGQQPTPESINSATNQWFVNLNDNTFLDSPANNGGFTVFAQVVGDGMEYFEAINGGMNIYNLNPDYNDDGVRDAGPFYNSQASSFTDGVPVLGTVLDNLVILNRAARIEYFGADSTTNIAPSGLTFSQRDVFIDTGAVFTGTGKLIVNSNRTMGIREGTVLSQHLASKGTVAPGLQIGMVTVPAYQQTIEGTLDIQLGGPVVDTGYDRLSVTGLAQLAGRLKVSLVNSYHPLPGARFTVLTAGSITGSFSTVELPELGDNMFWNLSATANAVTLHAVGGDYDHDGEVDAADYVVWRNTMGNVAAAFSGADGNGDFIVDAADYTIWRDNLGRVEMALGGSSGAVSATAVPEPSSVWMLLLAGAFFRQLFRRR